MGFAGLRVLSLESRRALEVAKLIRNQGGDATVVASMREVPLERNEETFRFAERLFAGEFDMMILLTGVGTRQLNRVLTSRFPAGAFAEALRRIAVVARGPKPVAALRELDVPATVVAPAPNTWREVLAVTEGRPERRIAVQEYGRRNDALLDALRHRGAEVTPVRVYQWDLPEDTAPLRNATARLAAGGFDVVLFTTAIQAAHLLRIAHEMGVEDAVLAALRRGVVASIGPTTSDALEESGIAPDLEPSQPRMGFLVQETAQCAAAILAAKRVPAQAREPG